MSDKDSFLRDIVLCKDLSDGQFTKLQGICSTKWVEAGTTLMREGDPGESIFFLAEGEVEIVRTLLLASEKGDGQREEKSVLRLKASDAGPNFFGEMSLLSNLPRSATVRAVTNCHLYEVGIGPFDQLCSDDPELGYKVMKRLNERLSDIVRKNNQDIAKLTTALALSLDKHL